MVQEFADAIFAPGLTAGQLLAPVKTPFGWHVVQIMSYPTDEEWMTILRNRIESGELTFADAARDNSDTTESADGGSLGWIGRGQLAQAREDAIFAAPIGKPSQTLVVDGEGIYMFLVSKEETREPDAEQKAALETSAFSIWYSKEKANAVIERDSQITGGI